MPISRCNSAGFQILLGLALFVVFILATQPLDGPVLVEINDKVAHALTFLTLAFLADAGWPETSFNWTKAGWLFAYGVAIEVTQSFIPFRMFSFLDMLANGSGLLLYAVVMFPLLKKFAWR